jgi:predicted DCC family thiol-disulfide oxidoreductase YuxK
MVTSDSQLARGPLILFDGVCNLCNAAVQWVIARDDDARFRFASLQSEAARLALIGVLGPEGVDSLPDSIVLMDETGVHTRSSAAIRIAEGLGRPYSLLSVGRVLPRPLRDAVYDFVARNRYRWFGRRETCMVPTPELTARFVDADEPEPSVPGGRFGEAD